MTDFTHLHVHTQYSILDGLSDINKLVKKAVDYGMEALAITDHGSMFGVFEFYSACVENGIKPIIGCEVYVAHGSRFEKKRTEEKSSYHLILLAKNDKGYENLCMLCSLGWREGFYSRPRVDKEILQKYSEGLICCSACLGGEIPYLILNSNRARVEEAVNSYFQIFGEDFYLEMMNHNIPEQAKVNPVLDELGKKFGIKCIASNDIHFIDKDDFMAHRILVCVNTGKKLGEQKGMLYTGEEYLKTGDEMAQMFSEYPQAVLNTREVADKIEKIKIKRAIVLPVFPIPEGFTDEMEYLRHLTWEGAKERWGEELSDSIKERLEFEISTVERMGFPGYFLIVWDFISEARNMGVFVGPGRGSAAGSAMAYCLKITNVDPLKYKLLFERFLNPGRISMPDMDIDFDDAGRAKVIEYVVNKYGQENVAQIVTFGTMAGKSAIKDVARTLDLSLAESSRLSKLVDNLSQKKDEKENDINGGKVLHTIAKDEIFAKELNNPNPLVVETLKYATQLEGSIRSTGTHACGMIIAPQDLKTLVPLSNAKDTDMAVVQIEGTFVEKVGLLKMDFLGLSTLTIIKNCLNNIQLRHGKTIDLDSIPLDDELTYELFSKGETTAIFQFESDGMRKYLIDLKPSSIEDLTVMNALYRPGPMDFIPSYIERKHGIKPAEYDIPVMEDILKETYGITVYQEQVMQLSQLLGNFSQSEADTLRKAMGKKQLETLQKMQVSFLDGCKANNHNEDVCKGIWEKWVKFAKYAFNKSHSTCYAILAYQAAYLKANYPAEYMAAALTNSLTDAKKIRVLSTECKRLKIPILGPDINESYNEFIVNKEGQIRYGLSACKGVGEKAAEELITERNNNGAYKDIFDFAKRLNPQKFSKRCFEAVAKAGGFDCLKELHRATFFYQKNSESPTFIDTLISFSKSVQGDTLNMTSLFGNDLSATVSNPQIPICEPWSKMQLLQNEYEITDCYISGHPLEEFSIEKTFFSNAEIADVSEKLKQTPLRILDKTFSFLAIITKTEHLTAKNGNKYGRFTIQDASGSYDFTVFKDQYLELAKYMTNDLPVILKARGAKPPFREEIELQVIDINQLDGFIDKKINSITLTLSLDIVTEQIIKELSKLCNKNVGTCSISFTIIDKDQSVSLKSKTKKISPKPVMQEIMQRFSGKISMKIN